MAPLGNLPQWLLRMGLAFAFLYPPIAALGDPYSWLSYFPPFLRTLSASWRIPDLALLHGFGTLEALIALWILSGKKIYYPAAVAAALLIAIVFFNHADFEVLFRDLSLAAVALALAIDGWQKDSNRMPNA